MTTSTIFLFTSGALQVPACWCGNHTSAIDAKRGTECSYNNSLPFGIICTARIICQNVATLKRLTIRCVAGNLFFAFGEDICTLTYSSNARKQDLLPCCRPSDYIQQTNRAESNVEENKCCMEWIPQLVSCACYIVIHGLDGPMICIHASRKLQQKA